MGTVSETAAGYGYADSGDEALFRSAQRGRFDRDGTPVNAGGTPGEGKAAAGETEGGHGEGRG
ncbi:hypothetical protein D3C76_1814550 [compost metagenome]